ncbi:hypothetical protein [Sphingomonas sp. KR3-1]|uniref:hypothetical protein n=1 Tax=Sphingomonas sp. KR3-1 TaxID=3156611 RepID=UPI0032B4206E
MLRLLVMIAAAVWFAAALGMALWDAASWPMLAMAALVLLGTVFERFYYRGAVAAPDAPGWQPTAERFLDEETGRPVTVWYNPKTGERRYVDEG